jgi:hypothetical protein
MNSHNGLIVFALVSRFAVPGGHGNKLMNGVPSFPVTDRAKVLYDVKEADAIRFAIDRNRLANNEVFELRHDYAS